jgi:AcrR family transcriptional regulator
MSTTRPPGRRPGSADVTRQEILGAARSTFGEVGFERATIRAIAERAAVDPALVHHHFGTKESLFAAAHELLDPTEVLEPIFTGPSEEMGEHLTRFYLTFIAAPGSPAVSLIRATATNEAAAHMLREFLEQGFLAAAERHLDATEPRRRMALCGSHLLGVVFGRAILKVPELADPPIEELVAIIAPTIQRYLTGELDDSLPLQGGREPGMAGEGGAKR